MSSFRFKLSRIPSGIRFGILGGPPSQPAPTLFGFAGSAEDALGLPQFSKTADLLVANGWLAVSLELPAYGEDVRKGESGDPSGTLVIQDWRARLNRGENLMADFVHRCSAVLDHLIDQKWTDPSRVAAYGISRGAFAAVHLAAHDPRVRCIAGIAPLVDFLALREFAGMESNEATKACALIHLAPKLAGRSIWMTVGNNDDRVDTDRVIAFARAVAKHAAPKSADEKPADVELHVCPSMGHAAPRNADEDAAAWISRKLS